MDITAARAEMESGTRAEKLGAFVNAVGRIVEHQRRERERIIGRNLERLAERQTRAFIAPRRTILRVPPLPPRQRAVLDAIEAAGWGDYGPVRELVKERIGERDALPVVGLLHYGDEVPFRVMDEFISDARPFIPKEEYDALIEELVEEAHRGISLKGKLRRALRYLDNGDGTTAERKREEIRALGLIVGWKPRLIAKELMHEGPEEPDKPGVFSPLDELSVPPREEEDALEEEDKRMKVIRSLYSDGPLFPGFTERDILILRSYGNDRPDEQVAAELGVRPDNLRKLRSRAYEKVRKLA